MAILMCSQLLIENPDDRAKLLKPRNCQIVSMCSNNYLLVILVFSFLIICYYDSLFLFDLSIFASKLPFVDSR